MKKKSIRKVLTTMHNVCLKNDYCVECPLHDSICLNTEDLDDRDFKKAVNIIKEIIDSEESKNIT